MSAVPYARNRSTSPVAAPRTQSATYDSPRANAVREADKVQPWVSGRPCHEALKGRYSRSLNSTSTMSGTERRAGIIIQATPNLRRPFRAERRWDDAIHGFRSNRFAVSTPPVATIRRSYGASIRRVPLLSSSARVEELFALAGRHADPKGRHAGAPLRSGNAEVEGPSRAASAHSTPGSLESSIPSPQSPINVPTFCPNTAFRMFPVSIRLNTRIGMPCC